MRRFATFDSRSFPSRCSSDVQSHPDPGPHGLDPAAGQAARRHCRPADDRPCRRARARESGLGRVVVATDTRRGRGSRPRAWLRGGDDARWTTSRAPTGSSRRSSALDPDAQGRDRRQRPGRPADHRSGDDPRGASRRSRQCRRRHRDAGRRDLARRGEGQSQRRQDRRLAAVGQRGCARSISPAPPRPGARGRSTITSGSMPIAARRWSASCRCRRRALERRERLEQLRALEAGMRIDAEIVQTVPLGVDTPDDLERAREQFCRNDKGRTHAPKRPTGYPSRASPAPIPTPPAATCFPAWSRCPARPSRTRSTRSRPARPISP